MTTPRNMPELIPATGQTIYKSLVASGTAPLSLSPGPDGQRIMSCVFTLIPDGVNPQNGAGELQLGGQVVLTTTDAQRSVTGGPFIVLPGEAVQVVNNDTNWTLQYAVTYHVF